MDENDLKKYESALFYGITISADPVFIPKNHRITPAMQQRDAKKRKERRKRMSKRR